ncbi:hypothetical protein [Amycolatopsis jejuensis]|uniref:hypothetical protein n=1 Tax=Amycolatopsis jejuensis TaxID=330084 RepID=UPI0005262600|nr:hypothetical protein [Amycolatopsis jejuensis]
MTDQTGGDQPQKTVAELLAQHGQQVDGTRRRRRRAAEDDDEPGTRRAKISDTAPQAIIDRVTADGGTPPPPSRPAGGRRRPDTPPVPRSAPQDSGQYPRPVNGQGDQHDPEAAHYAPPANGHPRPVNGQHDQEPGQYPRPVNGQQDSGYVRAPQESGQYPRPGAQDAAYDSGYLRPPQESGQFPRPGNGRQDTGYNRPPQESGAYPRPGGPQDSGYVRAPQESGQMPVPPRGRAPRPPVPGEETRGQVPPVRRPAPGPDGTFAARLDGADPEAPEAPGPMASGAFPAPGRPRRAPARRPAPKQEAHTEQFDAVDASGEAPGISDDAPPAGLAGWRQRREQEQLEDTEVGVMPVVPPADADAEPAEYSGPPTQGYPAPEQDDLAEYEREFAEPAYPAGEPDFEGDDGYAYEQGDEYEDYPDEAVAEEPVAEEAPAEPAASAGKQWLTLAGQLALGVVGGAGVWLGFNWLWVNLAPAALVGALLVIVALVWIVRKIRRAEDLQTTLLAILVGLVVTVSPAALLLVAK